MKKMFFFVVTLAVSMITTFGQGMSESSSYPGPEMIYFSDDEINLIFNQSKLLNPEIKDLDQSLIAGSKINFLLDGVTIPITARAGDSPRSILRNGISKEYWSNYNQVQESVKNNGKSTEGIFAQKDNNFKRIGTLGICMVALVVVIILLIMGYMYFNKKKYQ